VKIKKAIPKESESKMNPHKTRRQSLPAAAKTVGKNIMKGKGKVATKKSY